MSGEGPYLKVKGLLRETKDCTYESKGRFRQVYSAYSSLYSMVEYILLLLNIYKLNLQLKKYYNQLVS